MYLPRREARVARAQVLAYFVIQHRVRYLLPTIRATSITPLRDHKVRGNYERAFGVSMRSWSIGELLDLSNRLEHPSEKVVWQSEPD